MKKILKKIKLTLKLFWNNLFWGLKSTDEEIFTQVGTETPVGTTINQEVHTNRVSKDLLSGKVTRQVEELRYRTYAVDRESKNYEYFSPTLAMKRDKQDSKFVKYENSDNLEVITIQINYPQVKNVLETLNEIDEKRDIDKNCGQWIKVYRENGFLPRYKLEEFTTRLVVKRLNDDKKAKIEFYVSKYPPNNDFKSTGFVHEVERTMKNNTHSDVIDITGASFVTLHAYKLDDMLLFEFDNAVFDKIIEFDGHYIISFTCDMITNGKDLTEKYESKTMKEKYATKQKKEVVYDFTTDNLKRTFVCEGCGKVIEYDPMLLDKMDISQIDGEEKTNNTEYLDLQVAEQTYGKQLCSDCLRKELNNLYKELGINEKK